MIQGLKSIAQERYRQEREMSIFSGILESAKIADMFLAEEGGATTHDVYLGESESLLTKDAEEDERIEALIEQIPETDLDATEEELAELIEDEPVDIEDVTNM